MLNPLEAAQNAALRYPVQPAALVSYKSAGRLLIIGTVEQVIAVLPSLKNLKSTVLLTETSTKQLKQKCSAAEIPILEKLGTLSITGYLGAFDCSINGIPEAKLHFDLVLDLQLLPEIQLQVLPIGYYAPGGDSQKLSHSLAELPEMQGHFDKARFFTLDDEKCAHSNSTIIGCQQCIQACATAAIQSINQQIHVNPFLCQGCGDCSTVCPSGAISYNFPNRQDTLNRLRSQLQAFIAAGGRQPVIFFHDQEEIGPDPHISDKIIPCQVEAIGSVGIEIWLATLTYGAAQVWLLDSGELTAKTRESLHSQLKLVNQILQGMGYPEKLIRFATMTALNIQNYPVCDIPAAVFSGDLDKRNVMRMAVDHLYEFAPIQKAIEPLSKSAPFGTIQVEGDNCTLCMSCVSVCPEGALLAGQDEPKLKFIESHCVQCGICQSACPENVITLIPQYTYSSIQARKPEILHQEELVLCIQCNKAFATESMIKSISKKLQNHPMFQGENRRQLLMCEQCRVLSQFNKV